MGPQRRSEAAEGRGGRDRGRGRMGEGPGRERESSTPQTRCTSSCSSCACVDWLLSSSSPSVTKDVVRPVRGGGSSGASAVGAGGPARTASARAAGGPPTRRVPGAGSSVHASPGPSPACPSPPQPPADWNVCHLDQSCAKALNCALATAKTTVPSLGAERPQLCPLCTRTCGQLAPHRCVPERRLLSPWAHVEAFCTYTPSKAK